MFIAMSGCDQPILSNYQEQLVIASFIYANEPVDSVVLHRTTPFGQYYDDLDYAVDSATVIITSNGVSDTLLPGALKGRYYLPASKLVVQGGQTYTITVIAKNEQTGGTHYATSTTTVPMPIHLDSLAESIRGLTVTFDTTNLSQFAFLVSAGPVDEPNREYMLSVSALDTNYGRIYPESGTGLDSTLTVRYSMVETGPNIPITPRLFLWYGPTLVTFYALDSNWVDYQRQLQQGIDYQPSLNHVIGAIGIFGSAARDTVSFFLKKKQ